MKRTYRCTNVKFCMEDENQRRAWEYLHGLDRMDGSYGKVLSDALIAVIDAHKDAADAVKGGLLIQTHGSCGDAIKAVSSEIAGIVLEGIKEILADKASCYGAEQDANESGLAEREQEDEIAEDMLDFAFTMSD